jgi:hypothetical protein
VTLLVPGAAGQPDPVTGRPTQAEPVEVPDQACRLSQRATTNVSSASEVNGDSSFTTTLGDVLFPAGTEVTEKTVVVDVSGVLGRPGARWLIDGEPAFRRSFVSAALLYVSDMQGV